jgi:hypothetical protein
VPWHVSILRLHGPNVDYVESESGGLTTSASDPALRIVAPAERNEHVRPRPHPNLKLHRLHIQLLMMSDGLVSGRLTPGRHVAVPFRPYAASAISTGAVQPVQS